MQSSSAFSRASARVIETRSVSLKKKYLLKRAPFSLPLRLSHGRGTWKSRICCSLDKKLRPGASRRLRRLSQELMRRSIIPPCKLHKIDVEGTLKEETRPDRRLVFAVEVDTAMPGKSRRTMPQDTATCCLPYKYHYAGSKTVTFARSLAVVSAVQLLRGLRQSLARQEVKTCPMKCTMALHQVSHRVAKPALAGDPCHRARPNAVHQTTHYQRRKRMTFVLELEVLSGDFRGYIVPNAPNSLTLYVSLNSVVQTRQDHDSLSCSLPVPVFALARAGISA